MHARTSSSGVASETLLAGCLGSEDATAGGGVPRHARFKNRRLYVLHDRRLAAGGDCCRNDEYAAADAAIVEPSERGCRCACPSPSNRQGCRQPARRQTSSAKQTLQFWRSKQVACFALWLPCSAFGSGPGDMARF